MESKIWRCLDQPNVQSKLECQWVGLRNMGLGFERPANIGICSRFSQATNREYINQPFKNGVSEWSKGNSWENLDQKKHGVFTNHHWMKISWPVISCTELPLFCRLGQNITPSTWQAISSNYQPVFKHGGIFTGFGRTSREIKPCPQNVKVKLGIIIPGMYGQFSKVEWTFSRVVASFNQFEIKNQPQ